MTASTRDLPRKANVINSRTAIAAVLIFLYNKCGDSMKEYKTVEREAEDFFIEKKSRFIGYAIPVKTQEEAVAFINRIRTKHWDATHNVYAYVLRDNNIQRYSDDGEPSGTAGVPVLDVLLKEELTDVCVVATRYFGGTLLGAGGLVRAYSHTSKIAVEAAGIITMAQCSIFEAVIDYSFYDRFLLLLQEVGANVLNTAYADAVTLMLSIKEQYAARLQDRLTDVSNGKYTLRFLRSEFAKA